MISSKKWPIFAHFLCQKGLQISTDVLLTSPSRYFNAYFLCRKNIKLLHCMEGEKLLMNTLEHQKRAFLSVYLSCRQQAHKEVCKLKVTTALSNAAGVMVLAGSPYDLCTHGYGDDFKGVYLNTNWLQVVQTRLVITTHHV